jgi:hypothetical protein
MKHRARVPAHGVGEQRGVGEIAFHAFQARVGFHRESGIDQHDLGNGRLLAVCIGQGAAFEQGLGQSVAQESAAAGDQYFHVFLNC